MLLGSIGIQIHSTVVIKNNFPIHSLLHYSPDAVKECWGSAEILMVDVLQKLECIGNQ